MIIGDESDLVAEGGLHTLQGTYPAFTACSGLENLTKLDGLIFCADAQVG